MTNEQAHRLAREKGVSRPLYALVKAFVAPFMRLYFGLRVSGADRIPADGPVIIAPNHKSFWDSFFIGASMKRPVRFMGKSELFEKRYGEISRQNVLSFLTFDLEAPNSIISSFRSSAVRDGDTMRYCTSYAPAQEATSPAPPQASLPP